jgi:hypothetical protein
MLVLLDENVPQRLRLLIVSHEVRTVAYQGWRSLLNGALLAAAEAAGFEVFVTADQSIRYPQNMAGRSIALVALHSDFDRFRQHRTAIPSEHLPVLREPQPIKITVPSVAE